jgi:glycosyltransferase involved in cell wall biosynthesis
MQMLQGARPQLRIAQVAPLFVAVPPRRYGGTERVVHDLTEGLVKRGHDVTLFASGGSVTSASLYRGSPRPLWELPEHDRTAYAVLQVEEVLARSASFDVVHWHVDYLHLLAGRRAATRSLTTLHGRLDGPSTRMLLALHRDEPLVSISDAQRRPTAGVALNWVGTVHHGLDLSTIYQMGDGSGGYLAFVGRSSREKGLATAIRVAIRCGLPIKVAARVGQADTEYHMTEVMPLLEHPLVEWLGEVGDTRKAALLRDATALLMPLDWDEPFGLAFIESLACGTPVITRSRGSLPELVRPGVHGFFAESEDELVEACLRIGSIDRRACRRWAVANFLTERMVDDYERIYESLLLSKVKPTVVEREEEEPAAAG